MLIPLQKFVGICHKISQGKNYNCVGKCKVDLGILVSHLPKLRFVVHAHTYTQEHTLNLVTKILKND
jgi:hypothetical protein